MGLFDSVLGDNGVWRSVDTVERDGETYVLQQAVIPATGQTGGNTHMDNHRLVPLSEALEE